MRKYDGQGNFTQVGHTHDSISGTTLGQERWGTYDVDANCTGMAYLQLQGAPFVIEERTVIVENGLEVRSISANPPPVVVTGVHRKVRVW